MSVPVMVVLTPPLLVLAVAASLTRQGKPLSMQQSPFLIDPACTAVYSSSFSSAIVDIITYSFIAHAPSAGNFLAGAGWWHRGIIQMRWAESKPRLQRAKEWVFEFVYTLDTNQFTNSYARLVSTVMELSALHYFYIHPAFAFLATHALFADYFRTTRQYLPHLYAFAAPLPTLLALALFPAVILLALLVKKFGPNKVLVPALQLALFLYPLLWIKVMVEVVSALAMGRFLYLVLPLAALNLLFGAVALLLLGRPFRLLELPLVLLLELRGNVYFTVVLLLARLVLLGYLNAANGHALGFYFEAGLMALVAASPFCDDQLLNNLGFLAVGAACLAAGANAARRALQRERSILSFADLLEAEDEEEAVFEVYRRVEEHHVGCELADCLCQGFYAVERGGLAEWVYRFEEQRLRRGEGFAERLEYAERCWSHYDFKLSGLVRVCEGKPRGLLQEYQVFRACSVYEHNLRKQDKNYRYGEPYRNAQEELQAFHAQLATILQEIRKFWALVTAFDGSTKFLKEILVISRAISGLRETFAGFVGKYDEELREFRYGYELFLSVVLNEEVAEEQEVLVPEPCAFLVTNGPAVLNANNAFLVLAGQPRESVVGHPYAGFVPDVYRDIHRVWAGEFVERVEDFEGKSIAKCFAVGSLEIKLVEMEHRVLPRFLDGLEIFTLIHPPAEAKGERRESFVFLVEKETFYIKNVEAAFFDIVKFRVSQRSFKLLQEMSLTSIFEHFTTSLAENPARETAIFPHFLEEFTYTKTKRKTVKAKTKPPSSRTSQLISQNTKAHAADNEQIFEFSVLPGCRPEDPYVKVRFTLKEERAESVPTEQESLSRVEAEQAAEHERPKKEESFGFTVPYLLLAVLGVCHIFYALGRGAFDAGTADLYHRYQFYLAFDYTTLGVLSAFTGADRTAELRALWIEGYGDFSESFNAFRRVSDPLFMQYFSSQVAVLFHNRLYADIESSLLQAGDAVRSYQVLVLVVLLLAMGCYVVDLLLTLRYTFFIESKVGALLLRFVMVEPADVKEILALIHSFEATILNAQENTSFKPPLETGEDSAFELMKGGGYSLNNSMVGPEPQQETPKEHSNSGKKRVSSMMDRERVSLSLMREELKHSEKSKFKRDSSAREEHQEEKSRSISLFKRQYRSCGFIIRANKRLFLFIFTGFLVSMAVLCVAIAFLYSPFDYLPQHLHALDHLKQTRIILLKSQTEILVDSSLLPAETLSNTLLELLEVVDRVASGAAMTAFNAEFTAFMNTNVCSASTYNCSLLANDNNLHEYGIKVVSQYLEDYFRQHDAAALTADNPQNRLIIYAQLLFAQLVDHFLTSSAQYCADTDAAELRMVVIGSLSLLLGMALTHYSLRDFKDRIENSRSLLQIIPKEIKRKQEKEIEELTLKELSTP